MVLCWNTCGCYLQYFCLLVLIIFWSMLLFFIICFHCLSYSWKDLHCVMLKLLLRGWRVLVTFPGNSYCILLHTSLKFTLLFWSNHAVIWFTWQSKWSSSMHLWITLLQWNFSGARNQDWFEIDKPDSICLVELFWFHVFGWVLLVSLWTNSCHRTQVLKVSMVNFKEYNLLVHQFKCFCEVSLIESFITFS